MRVPIGSGGWYLCERRDQQDGKFTELRASKTLALQLAKQFRGDLSATSALRGLLGHAFPPLSDTALAEEVASRLTSGVWVARRRGAQWSPTIRERAQQAIQAAPSESRRSAAVSRPAGPPPDPPLFPDDIDAGAIAAAQKEAAALGLPFCEECLKAQLAAAR
ncbi:MAG: hypothetical protein ABI806_12135 [Candidatus Solibacter sp.]